MIVITYQDEAGAVQVLASYNDDRYDTARQTAEGYFTNAGKLVWLELLLTEKDGDLGTSVCLDRWDPPSPLVTPPRSTRPHSLSRPSSSSDKSFLQEIALGIGAAMIGVAFLIGLNSYIGSIAPEKIHTYQEGGLGYK